MRAAYMQLPLWVRDEALQRRMIILPKRPDLRRLIPLIIDCTMREKDLPGFMYQQSIDYLENTKAIVEHINRQPHCESVLRLCFKLCMVSGPPSRFVGGGAPGPYACISHACARSHRVVVRAGLRARTTGAAALQSSSARCMARVATLHAVWCALHRMFARCTFARCTFARCTFVRCTFVCCTLRAEFGHVCRGDHRPIRP